MKCPHCSKETTLKISNPEEYRRRKILNAKRSRAKAKKNGTKLGRPKLRNDELIKKLRSDGLSIRAIALKVGLSTAAIQRGIRS